MRTITLAISSVIVQSAMRNRRDYVLDVAIDTIMERG